MTAGCLTSIRNYCTHFYTDNSPKMKVARAGVVGAATGLLAYGIGFSEMAAVALTINEMITTYFRKAPLLTEHGAQDTLLVAWSAYPPQVLRFNPLWSQMIGLLGSIGMVAFASYHVNTFKRREPPHPHHD